MTEEIVTFLQVPVQGQRANIMCNGQAATTSPAKNVEFRNGWYRVLTISGNVYIGQVMPQRQETPAVDRTTYQQPQIAQAQSYQPQQHTPAAPTAPYSLAPYPQRRTLGVGEIVAIIVSVIVVGFIGLALLGALIRNVSEDTGNNWDTSANRTIETPAEDFTLQEWYFKTGEYGTHHIVGTAVNNTDRTFGYVQVEFNLYDSSGAQVGSTLANCNNVEPHGTWKFDAIILEENVRKARFKGFTNF